MAAISLEKEILVRGVKYKIIHENGESVLRRFDKKHNMWVTLKFSKYNDQTVLDEVASLVSNIFTS